MVVQLNNIEDVEPRIHASSSFMLSWLSNKRLLGVPVYPMPMPMECPSEYYGLNSFLEVRLFLCS